ncbi:hypothetical protein AJ88_23790 [Mesorhizobium amorphae CCBAU 01583]|nr:hypothetical protein AJ88_23790 [Mesorhizobium amorphae CCBAU 01583]
MEYDLGRHEAHLLPAVAQIILAMISGSMPAICLGDQFTAALPARATYVLAAKTAGYSFLSLLSRILEVALRRYFGIGIPYNGWQGDRISAHSLGMHERRK